MPTGLSPSLSLSLSLSLSVVSARTFPYALHYEFGEKKARVGGQWTVNGGEEMLEGFGSTLDPPEYDTST